MGKIGLLLWGSFCILLGTWACGEVPDAAVVAQVGSVQITKDELKSFVTALPPGLRSKNKKGEDARRDYLQSVIDRELMFMEARNRGLDTARVLVEALEDKVLERILYLYRVREIFSQIHIDREEIEQRIREEGLDRERMAWGIAARTSQEIEQIVEDLEAGVVFEDVARTRSVDPHTRENGGELGFMGVYQAGKLGIPPAIFHALEAGKISEPLPSANGYFLIRFSEERTADTAPYRELIARELAQQKSREIEAETAEMLAWKLNARLQPEGLSILLQKGRGATATSIDLSETESRTPLYLFEGGQVGLGDYLDVLKKSNLKQGLEDSTNIAAVAERLVLRPALFIRAAHEAGISAEEELVQWKEDEGREMILINLRQTEVLGGLRITDEELRLYYDEQADLFRQQDTLWVCEVLSSTEEEAHQVREVIEAGAKIEEEARAHSLRAGAQQTGGVLHFHPIDKYRYPRLLPAVLAAEVGELVGPLAVEGGYSVFRLLRQARGAQLAFAEVRNRVRALVKARKEKEQFGVFIQGLRTKYEDQVRIFDDHLAGSLPDEFLKSL